MCLEGKVDLIQCSQRWDIQGRVESMITLATGLNNQKNNGARVDYHWVGKPETKTDFGGGGINSYGVIILSWIRGEVTSVFQFIF